MDSWPNTEPASSSSGRWGTQGCAKPRDSVASPVLATYDGLSRLQFDASHASGTTSDFDTD
ncbi:hypothetical protein IWW55_006191 [Coemansia sp. RSA 2706]|nr:hypothetical protein IWW55_006191 [Coemansia sp. RSA 2706]